MTPEQLAKLAQEQKEKIRRMTNRELWEQLMSAVGSDWCGDEVDLMEHELEWRLRKIGFLPALPLAEESQRKPKETP